MKKINFFFLIYQNSKIFFKNKCKHKKTKNVYLYVENICLYNILYPKIICYLFYIIIIIIKYNNNNNS